MEYLESLVRKLKFASNRNRTNLGGKTMFYGNRKCLFKGIYSNTRRQGEILEHVRSMLGPEINAVCINKNVVCGLHRDKTNFGPSYICFMGDYTKGGALCLEDGRRVEEKHVLAWPLRWCSHDTLQRASRRLEVFCCCIYFKSASKRSTDR